MVKKFSRSIYKNVYKEDMYRDTKDSICIWDFNQDFERLYEIIVEEFKHISREMKPVVYEVAESDYDEFLKENQKEIIDYKRKIENFFRERLKELIKARMSRNWRKLEELYS